MVFELFERCNRELGTTIVMVTHDPGFAERAGRRVVLKDGRVVSDERGGNRDVRDMAHIGHGGDSRDSRELGDAG